MIRSFGYAEDGKPRPLLSCISLETHKASSPAAAYALFAFSADRFAVNPHSRQALQKREGDIMSLESSFSKFITSFKGK